MARHTYIGQKATLGHERPEGCRDKDLITGMLPESGLMYIVGNPGAGKTFLTLLIAACLATRRKLVEFDLETASNDDEFARARQVGGTLFLVGEGYDRFHWRIEAAYDAIKDYPEGEELSVSLDHLPVITLNVTGLTGINDLPTIKERVQAHAEFLDSVGFPLRLIVLDTLITTCQSANENDNIDMYEILEWLREYGREFNCLVIVTGHPPKGQDAKKGSIRGAGSQEGTADVIWHIKKIKKGISEVTITKIKDGLCEGNKYNFEIVSYGCSAAIRPVKRSKTSDLKNDKKSKEGCASLSMPQQRLLKYITDAPNGSADTKYLKHQLLMLYGYSSALPKEEKRLINDKVRKEVMRGLSRLLELEVITVQDDEQYALCDKATDIQGPTVDVCTSATGNIDLNALPEEPDAQSGNAPDDADVELRLFRESSSNGLKALEKIASMLSPPPPIPEH